MMSTQRRVVTPLVCWRCSRVLAKSAGPGTEIECPRCHARNQVPGDC